ncbi:integrase [Sphingobium lactosutens]|uniref:tyrosine-type recombinase/integrase n=1 Tax=Sphingobium lactosutens TaxID=522773 RepID=UPI0015BE6F9A|nr:integrase arm-type DNA-binding domain-containing protein [Sphingobium lactosutens]NWK97614.1 integrase [Sphingobium lactosutens]
MLSNEIIVRLAGRGRNVRRSDGGGLFVNVTSGGKVTWYLSYRHKGKQKTVSGGSYPEISVDMARVWREELKRKIKQGLDPSAFNALLKTQDYVFTTFEELAREWMEKKSYDWDRRVYSRIEVVLKNSVFPYIGNISVRDIGSNEVLDVLKRVEQRGNQVLPLVIRGYINGIFRTGMPDGRVLANPCVDLDVAMRKRLRVKNFSALPAKDFPAFYAALNADSGARLVHLALRWTILTMVRSNETRYARWDEFEGLSGPDPIWRIPGNRMKGRREHIFPLPPQAIKLLREIKYLNIIGTSVREASGIYLFPTSRN